MALMRNYEDTIRELGNALITSTAPGERVNADIKAWAKRTNHQNHGDVQQARPRPAAAGPGPPGTHARPRAPLPRAP